MFDFPLKSDQALRMTEAMQWPDECYALQSPFVVGVLEGEGIGPEVVRASLLLLDVIQESQIIVLKFNGGKIGLAALQESGQVLTPEVMDFCNNIFSRRGALFCGPGGGRFVYELRKEFDLYCKFVPIKPLTAAKNVSVLKQKTVENVDILIVRENVGGIYQGDFHTGRNRWFASRQTFIFL